MRLRTSVIILAALFSGCAAGMVHYDSPSAVIDENTLGPGDVFGVRVYGETDLSQDYRIGSDGTIDFPYLGRVKVEGLAVAQIEDTLSRKLKESAILLRPHVSVIVREINSRQIVITGQIAHPGTYPHRKNMTIAEAIAAAGGFTALADQNVLLTRKEAGREPQTYRIPVDAINEGRAPNLYIAPGDIILVRQSPI